MKEYNIKDRVYIHALNNRFNYTIKKAFEETSYAEFINDLPTTAYTPKKKDKIFILPNCTVPRFKLKQFCDSEKVALVKDMNKADAIFTSKEHLMNIVDILYGETYLKSDFIGYLNKINSYKEIIPELEKSESLFVSVSYGVKNSLVDINDIDNYNNKLYFKNEDCYQLFLNIKDKENVYDQKHILSVINTGGVMDQERYESIKRMFQSTNQEDVKLAMEAMANSDYQKSCVYLLLLVEEFGDVMYNSKTKNHVNFKSLLKFFNIGSLSGFRINNILGSLLYSKLLNQANLDLLMPNILEDLSERIRQPYFTIDKITPSDDILECLNDNYLDDEADTEIVDDSQDYLKPKMPLAAL